MGSGRIELELVTLRCLFVVQREPPSTYRSPVDPSRPQPQPNHVPQQQRELAYGVHSQQLLASHLQAHVREQGEAERQRGDPAECPGKRATRAKHNLRIQKDVGVLCRGVEVVHGDARPEAANQRDHAREVMRYGNELRRGVRRRACAEDN